MVHQSTASPIAPQSPDQVNLLKRTSPTDSDTLSVLNRGFFKTPSVSTRSSTCFEDPVLQVESTLVSFVIIMILVWICIESGFSKVADKLIANLCHVLFD